MFGKKMVQSLMPSLNKTGEAVGRSWRVEKKGTGQKDTPDVLGPIGGVPFHAAVKFRFDLGGNGTPEKGGK